MIPAADAPLLLIVQAVLVALQAAWLSFGAYSNLRWPRTNFSSVSDVVTMEMAREDPGIYEDHKHRAIQDPKTIARLFRGVALCEATVAGLLWIACAGLLAAAAGLVAADLARAAALIAVCGFTGVWGLFLVGGEWFQYWVKEGSPQSSHFFMLLWGLATLIFLK